MPTEPFSHFLLEREQITDAEKNRIFPQELILTRTTKANLERILYPLYDRRNLMLVGDAGIGKNALIYYLNRQRELPTIRFSFNQDTLPEDLSGSYRILPDGFQWSDGPLVEAMKHGYTFVADEMNLASPEILKRFASVFERRTLALLEKDGSEIKAHPRFSFVATQNPSRGFEGRKILPESISRYFTVVHLDPYPFEEECEIMQGLYPQASPALVEGQVSLQRALETAIWKNELAREDLEHYHFNIRTGIRFWNRFSVMPTEADDPEFIKNLLRFYCNVFRLQADRDKALEIMGGIFRFGTKELRQAADSFYSETFPVFQQLISGSLDIFPVTGRRSYLLNEMKESLAAGENLLLEGDEAARMQGLVEVLAAAHGKEPKFLFLSRGMHTSDIIGALRPQGHDRNSVAWLDGPLTAAVKNGDWLVLDNLEAAGSELVEKLNMLLDHAGMLSLPPEVGDSQVVVRHPQCRIIALKRHRRSRNTPTISRALRNRFFTLQVPVVTAAAELEESLAIAFQLHFNLQNDEDAALRAHLLLFHEKIMQAAQARKIGATQAEPLLFREEHLLRVVGHIARFTGRSDLPFQDVLRTAIETHYLIALPAPQDREYAADLWRRIAADLPLEELERALAGAKKKIINRHHDKKLTWDQKKHFRAANTGKAKPRLSGNPLKKGLRINTPETGGKIKEGEDAWYGQDTHGNRGVGEPAGGGGAWGYRTEELFQAFLKKYKPRWDYGMGITLENFYEIFGKMLEELETDFENLLDSEMQIERRLSSRGNRIDARKYLAYVAGPGDDRIFDRTRLHHSEDKLKGLEFVFLLNKGRRQFNFNSSVAAVVALQSCMEILWDRRVPLKTFGYSDFDNQKHSIDLVEYTQELEPGIIPERYERELVFERITDNWHGDTVEEAAILPDLPRFFSANATTRIVVIISDFRGHRARAKLLDDLNSRDNRQLYETVKHFTREGYIFLGVQTGSRYLAEHLFENSLWITEENFEQAPVYLAEKLTELILKHHKVQV